MGEGETVETGAVGRREVVGINAFMGGRETAQTKYIRGVRPAAGGKALGRRGLSISKVDAPL